VTRSAGWSSWCSPCQPTGMSNQKPDAARPSSPDSVAAPGADGGRRTGRSAEMAVAFPPPGVRPYPDPRPAGSAVSAASAMRLGLESAEAGTLMATLGMEVLERGAERTVVRMPVEGALQVAGTLHGGATAALVETAASVASRQAAPEGLVPVGAELQVSHLRPVYRGWVTAVAVPVHRGGRTAVYEVSISDEDGRLVGRGTLRSLFT